MSLLHDLINAGKKQELIDILRDSQPEEMASVINAPFGEKEQTPLHAAVLAGWPDAIPVLVRAGADMAKKNFYEETPLYTAIEAGSFDSAAALLQSGATANTRRLDDGITALQTAIEKKDAKLIQLLLDYGADAGVKTPPDEHGLNAFHYAAKTDTAIMSVLLKSDSAAAVHALGRDGKKDVSALRIALGRSDRDMVKQLLDYGVDVNERDDNGETPLFYLLGHRDTREETLPLIRLLLQRGADLDKARNFWDETPLFPAVRESFTEAASLLLSLGLDAKQKSHIDETPLHLAAEKWDVKIVSDLIAHGADIEAQDRTKRTPLHIAAHYNRPKVVEALLEAGANPFAKDKSGKTPRELALAPFQQNVRKLLTRKEQEIEIKREGYNNWWRRKATEDEAPAITHNPPIRSGRFQPRGKNHSSKHFGNRR